MDQRDSRDAGDEAVKMCRYVSMEEVQAKAERLGVSVSELIADSFKAEYGLSIDEIFASFNCEWGLEGGLE